MSQRSDDQNNLLLAVILSMAVMLGWQFFYAGPQMKAQQEKAAREKQEHAEKPAPGVADTTTPGAEGNAPTIASEHAPAVTREEAIGRSPRIAIDTPSLKGSIALKGGLIDDLVLEKYRETVDPMSPEVVLFSPPDAPAAYYAKYGWLNAGKGQLLLPSMETLWRATTTGPLTPSSPIELSWDNGQGLTFRRTISIDDNYMLKIAEEVENKGSGDAVLRPFALLYRLGKPKTPGYAVLHEGLIGVPGDAGLQEITYAKALEESGKPFENKTGGWLGITDKYWAAALIPDQNAQFSATLLGHKPQGQLTEFFTADYAGPAITISPGQRQKIEGQLYAGAKQVKVVEGYGQSLGIKDFWLMIDWGWFRPITRPLYYFLDYLYQILGNFGLAILAVTVLVKAAFFPLANKSYESMAKMKKLQPQMEVLRERFKDDKAKQQQELMALYQKEKINPLAGCLPILIQIPVFFALYKVLFVSIDMRHAPFFGWIRDLSATDPTSLFNLFGLLPFAAPEFLHIGAWPIVMGMTMWVQMQLNPPQPDPVQQQIFAWMPLLFTFLLASFPAGLVIYWAWNNVLSVSQQWYISQRAGAQIHLLDNLQKTFAPIARLASLVRDRVRGTSAGKQEK
jgi:YidC/Oxa1 family membrane protein insertase